MTLIILRIYVKTIKVLSLLFLTLISCAAHAGGYYLICKIDDKPKENENTKTYYFDSKNNKISSDNKADDFRNLKINKFAIEFEVYGENYCQIAENLFLGQSQPVDIIKIEDRYINRLTGEYKEHEHSCSNNENKIFTGSCLKSDKPLF